MKKVFLVLFTCVPAFAVPPTISPSTPVVSARGTIQFTSGDSVNWSLSPGSTGTITGGGLYTAPPSFAAKNIVAGCPSLPNDHIYNTRIDNLPVDTNSTARINNVSTTKLGFEVSFPLNIMTNATPTTNMTFLYTTENNGVAFPVLSFPYEGVENCETPNHYFNQDRHQLGVNTDTCQFIDIYNKYPTGVNGACPSCNAQSGIKYWGMGYLLPDAGSGGGATDAAGMMIQPLAIRYSELKSGIIKHALRFTLANGYIYSGILWPATVFTNQCGTIGTCFPYGSRLRLKSSFQIGSYSPTAQVYLTALKNYGMFLADGGATFHIQTNADVVADTTTWYAILNELNVSTISPNNFEQVDESSLAESTFSGHVNLTNAYVTPDNYASVIATRISDSVTSTQTIAIQPVTIGFKNVPYPPNSAGINVMAGTPQFSIPFWVNGATTTTATCTMSPTLGTLTSGCLYTAPASQVNSLSSATVTITPTADNSLPFTFPLVVFPSDGIRVRSGPKSAANSPAPTYDTAGNLQDAAGKWWWDDPIGSDTLLYARDDNYSPQSSWGSATDINLFYTAAHGASDAAYSMMVPNGNYTLSMGFGTSDSNQVANSSASIDSQGIVLLSTSSLTTTTYTPNTLSYPVQVTNNQFYFAIRQVVSTKFPDISKWSLMFVSALSNPNSQTLTGSLKLKGGVTLK